MNAGEHGAKVSPWTRLRLNGLARGLGVTLKKENVAELPADDLDTMLEDRRAPFRVDRLGSMVDGDAE